jgi:hypothetical protein
MQLVLYRLYPTSTSACEYWAAAIDGLATRRKNAASLNIRVTLSRNSGNLPEKLVRFGLKLLGGDLSAGVRLQLHIELVVFFHAGVACGARLDGGTEFLKMNADAIQGNGAFAIGAADSCQ